MVRYLILHYLSWADENNVILRQRKITFLLLTPEMTLLQCLRLSALWRNPTRHLRKSLQFLGIRQRYQTHMRISIRWLVWIQVLAITKHVLGLAISHKWPGTMIEFTKYKYVVYICCNAEIRLTEESNSEHTELVHMVRLYFINRSHTVLCLLPIVAHSRKSAIVQLKTDWYNLCNMGRQNNMFMHSLCMKLFCYSTVKISPDILTRCSTSSPSGTAIISASATSPDDLYDVRYLRIYGILR